MARSIVFAVRAWSPADVPTVYRLVEDGSTWPAWSPIGSFRLERKGTGNDEGVGAIRVFTTGTVRTREEVVAIQPDRSFAYAHLSGLPIRAHRASVELEEQEGGTRITWHEAFEATIPGTGWLLGRFLRWFVQRCADGLAAHAARQTHPGSEADHPA